MLTLKTTKVATSLSLPTPTTSKRVSSFALESREKMTTRVMSSGKTAAPDPLADGSIGEAGGTPNNRTTESAMTTTTPATITSDPGILCFHHCTVKVFCFTLPHICPQCKTPLDRHGSSDGGSGGGGGNKRHKNKKRTVTATKTNNSPAAITKGHHLLSSNGDVNNDNNRDDNEEQNDLDSCHRHSVEDNTNEVHVDEQDEGSDAEDDDSNDNNFVCHIMATRLLPFRLPYPFVRANQYPCAIVLRPTTGDFLNDYNNTTDLHIAVTTSTGCVVEFDRHGLRRHRTDNMSDWWQCLLVGDVPEPWYDYWDQVLYEVCQQPDKWTVSHYHEDKHNCYTFVLTFLQALMYDKLSEAATSKTTFCEKYIVPRTTIAGKYISLYRKLRDTGIYVHHTSHHNKHRNVLLPTAASSATASASSSSVSYGNKTGKHQHQQHQKLEHNKFNHSGAAPAMSTLDSTPKQQQQRHHQQNLHQQQHLNHMQQRQQQHQQQQQQQQTSSHHHNSIITRPHSTLCTIEE
ncbi:uncharacterized protein LOC106083964 [Stomoxys calcitrans]|uniref:uncharacterized protein LOC106083964 n=1 Tax=Stomoxys calcitrans TaxID=35570 RepID=UPI0027E29C3C|nr:uncharacterized protein LOC106083964 [Stomoxys calcitrans]XP_013102760.2 uncharacterized protein LOC106083964 [Stomoxys calcitrans]XP_059220228.1 uncharacterized protein LOC106083964 [Stomoxys calcitrans]